MTLAQLGRVVLVSFTLAGCGGVTAGEVGAPPGAPEDEAGKADAPTQNGERIYRIVDPENGSEVFLRLDQQGSALSGRFAMLSGPGGPPGFAPGTLSGDVAADGTYRIVMEMPNPFVRSGTVSLNFEGTLSGINLEGTLSTSQGESRPTTLLRVPRGTLRDGRPIVTQFRRVGEAEAGAACDLVALGAEVYALKNPAVEAALNGAFRAVYDGAEARCAPGGGEVQGGVSIMGVRPHVISYLVAFQQYVGDDLKDSPAERHTVDLESGAELRLFGDVLASGGEAAFLAVAEPAVDGWNLPSLTAAQRGQVKAQLKALVQSGDLTGRFLLTDRGVGLPIELAEHPRITSFLVPWPAIAPLVLAGGRGAEFLP